MKRPNCKFIAQALLAVSLMGLISGLPAESRKTAKVGPIIPMSPPPVQAPESLPQPDERGDSPLSVDTQSNGSDYMKFEPYNTFPREIDLWTLEKDRFIRSIPVLTPEKDAYAYSEVIFVPNLRQTICKMYLVKVAPPPVKAQPHRPSEDVTQPPGPPPDPKEFQERYDPAKTVQHRQALVQAGFEKVKAFDFKTLSIVDWNASGRRLLFKQRSGILHVGVRVTDILLFDEEKGTVTIYPEVQRIITNYWMTHGNQPNINKLSWEIQPLGWEPGSESLILMKAWAYDKREKKFLGLWRYDTDAERTTLVQLQDDPVAVAANGWMATPLPIPPQPDPKPTLKQRIKHPFTRQTNVAPGS